MVVVDGCCWWLLIPASCSLTKTVINNIMAVTAVAVIAIAVAVAVIAVAVAVVAVKEEKLSK